MKDQLEGLIAAVYTPMDRSGKIIVDNIKKQAQVLNESCVNGVFVCGTTGEGLSLSVKERMDIASEWASLKNDNLKVIVHIGHNCINDAKVLAEHSVNIGADAISLTPPTFFKPSKIEDLVNFCSMVTLQAPKLPFYYYHSPGMTGVNISILEFIRLAKKHIPTFAGIKYNHDNLMEYAECVEESGEDINISFGCDQLFVFAIMLGAKSAIGSTFNYAAPIYHKIMDSYKTGDIQAAQNAQVKVFKLVRVLCNFGVLPAGKAIMKHIGVDCGPTRLPVRSLDEDDSKKLIEEIKNLDIFSRPLRV